MMIVEEQCERSSCCSAGSTSGASVSCFKLFLLQVALNSMLYSLISSSITLVYYTGLQRTVSSPSHCYVAHCTLCMPVTAATAMHCFDAHYCYHDTHALQLANWLDAALYSTAYRPVPLLELAKCGETLVDVRGEVQRQLHPVEDKSKDPDHVVTLCRETCNAGGQVRVCLVLLWCIPTAKYFTCT
jgi:hypothetical protein